MAPKKSPQLLDTPDLESGGQDKIDQSRIPCEAAPVEKAAPSKRTPDKLDEEE